MKTSYNDIEGKLTLNIMIACPICGCTKFYQDNHHICHCNECKARFITWLTYKKGKRWHHNDTCWDVW